MAFSSVVTNWVSNSASGGGGVAITDQFVENSVTQTLGLGADEVVNKGSTPLAPASESVQACATPHLGSLCGGAAIGAIVGIAIGSALALALLIWLLLCVLQAPSKRVSESSRAGTGTRAIT